MARRRNRGGRFEVTGPGLDDISYEDYGPALSRSLTAALASKVDTTFYVRDAVTGDIYGHSERDGKLVTCIGSERATRLAAR